jgi:hypothetical protein
MIMLTSWNAMLVGRAILALTASSALTAVNVAAVTTGLMEMACAPALSAASSPTVLNVKTETCRMHVRLASTNPGLHVMVQEQKTHRLVHPATCVIRLLRM